MLTVTLYPMVRQNVERVRWRCGDEAIKQFTMLHAESGGYMDIVDTRYHGCKENNDTKNSKI